MPRNGWGARRQGGRLAEIEGVRRGGVCYRHVFFLTRLSSFHSLTAGQLPLPPPPAEATPQWAAAADRPTSMYCTIRMHTPAVHPPAALPRSGLAALVITNGMAAA